MKREVEFARTTKSLGWQKKGYCQYAEMHPVFLSGCNSEKFDA